MSSHEAALGTTQPETPPQCTARREQSAAPLNPTTDTLVKQMRLLTVSMGATHLSSA